MISAVKFSIPWPEKLSFRWLIAAAAILLAGQLAMGTGSHFAQLVFLYVLLCGVTVNLAGGLSRLGGFCVALMGLKIVIISQFAKTLFGEAGDSRLDAPEKTMGVLLAGLASVTVAAALSRLVQPKKFLFQTDLRPDALRLGAILTFLVGGISQVGVMATGMTDAGLMVGGLPGLLRQLTFCLSVSVVFSTAWVIESSGGRRFLGWFNLVPAGFYFTVGVLASSKQGMFEPFLLLALTAVAFRFRFSGTHVATGLLLIAFALTVLFPFGQVARSETRGLGLMDTIGATVEFGKKHFTSLAGFREMHERYQEAAEEAEVSRYYDRSYGMLERLSLIKMVDLLVVASDDSGFSEWQTVTHGFKMALPRFLSPRKPALNTGAFLGQKAGVIAEDNIGTQISFGFVADSYSAFGWAGAAIIPGVITLCFLLVFNYLAGPLTRNVWTICLFAELQHVFAEQTISGMTLTILRRPIWLLGIYFAIRGAMLAWDLMRHQPRPPARPAGLNPVSSQPAPV